MKKNIRLKSSILALVAGFSVIATQAVLADELAVQIMGVNDFHGALDMTGTARLEGETVRNAGTAALLDAYMMIHKQNLKKQQQKQRHLQSLSVFKLGIWLVQVHRILDFCKMNQL